MDHPHDSAAPGPAAGAGDAAAALWRPLAGPMPIKGRGAADNIAHRFETLAREAHDDGWGTLEQCAADSPAASATQLIEEHARSILTANDSPDVPFERSINPYRGCEHGCIYCYARPTHSYLNLSPGLDFETRIIAKVNAPELLRAALRRPGYVPRSLNLGSATDVYQPVERSLRLTRRIVEVLLEARHAFSVVTKSGGIMRDVDLYRELAAQRLVLAFVSITTLDNRLARILEPRAAAPQRRLDAIRALADAGVPVGLNVAPIIPFVNEPEIERIVAAGAAAGARSVHWTVVRLPWEVAPLFRTWLAQHLPERAERVMARIRDMRRGRDYDADWATRMKGGGAWAELIRLRVLGAAARAGLGRELPALDLSAFRPPAAAPANGSAHAGSATLQDARRAQRRAAAPAEARPAVPHQASLFGD